MLDAVMVFLCIASGVGLGILLLNQMLGLDGVVYAQPAADFVSTALASLFCFFIFRGLKQKAAAAEEAAGRA